MSRLWKLIGTILFWVTFPALLVYLVFRGQPSRVLISYGDDILLVRGWYGRDKWLLPGGGSKNSESPQQTALREVWEETGIQLAADQLENLDEQSVNLLGIKFSFKLFYCQLTSKPAVKRQKGEWLETRWINTAAMLPNQLDNDVKLALAAKARAVKHGIL